ncbi:putative membrane protein AbrB (regulator of aidB expression) [Saccharopolyspora lacisalsi]|uniref:Putative membrane protein AbrB (Regulator of aidB expression) n=1 Tax=Halosaccharopolyspora lacisalsi TaxID=1000566 RepID=A0A839DP67_9PSEU|nr:hypothetical protein [Halosaccharopolyspora lacisalsi]MBA8823782.1 putative membrane protein AbrB (regulator of aidB expression) [Halosaccharopolyspora lacisalsi]
MVLVTQFSVLACGLLLGAVIPDSSESLGELGALWTWRAGGLTTVDLLGADFVAARHAYQAAL